MYYTGKDIGKYIKTVKSIVKGKGTRDEKLKAVCELLRDNVSYYDWVGFYLADEDKRELILGPFVGEPTEHTRISFGQGICGQAAEIKNLLLFRM